MPYEWTETNAEPFEATLVLWPNRSLPVTGFVAFIGGTAALLALPLLAVVGSPVLWGLLPFLVLAVAGLWWGLRRNYRDGQLVERLEISRDRLLLTRVPPRGASVVWEANPYWATVRLDAAGSTAEASLTIKSEGEEVPLGACLSPDERRALFGLLLTAFAKAK